MNGRSLCLNPWRFAYHGHINEKASRQINDGRMAIFAFIYNVWCNLVYCNVESLWIFRWLGFALDASLGAILDGGVSGGVICASTGAQDCIVDRRKTLKQTRRAHPPIWIFDGEPCGGGVGFGVA